MVEGLGSSLVGLWGDYFVVKTISGNEDQLVFILPVSEFWPTIPQKGEKKEWQGNLVMRTMTL